MRDTSKPRRFEPAGGQGRGRVDPASTASEFHCDGKIAAAFGDLLERPVPLSGATRHRGACRPAENVKRLREAGCVRVRRILPPGRAQQPERGEVP
mgnify:CR=1 FL=1